MRLLTKKIHRAYPELDKFDDDVCKRYVKRAKRLQNAWKFWLIALVILPVSFVIWFGMMYATGFIVNEYENRIPESLQLVMFLFSGTAIAWLPAFSILLFRDRWLHRCIRKQLTGVQCGACGYSLLGLTVNNESDTPSVHCPECGHHLILKDMGLTQADIDPNYQPATP